MINYIYTIKNKSKHLNLKRIQFFLKRFNIPIRYINSNQFEVFNCNDWLQQTNLIIIWNLGYFVITCMLLLDGEYTAFKRFGSLSSSFVLSGVKHSINNFFCSLGCCVFANKCVLKLYFEY